MGHLINFLKLRDSVWQGIGGIVAIISIFISVFITYDIYQRSSVSPKIEVTAIEGVNLELPFVGKELQPRVKILVDNVEHKSLHFINGSISNVGNVAIKPDDYIEPISVKVTHPWELIAAEVDYSEPENINLEWTRVASDTYKMKPVLLNPGDTIGVNFFVVLPPLIHMPDTAPTVEWNGRITNVKSINTVNPFDSAVPIGISVIHGWSARLSALVILISLLSFSITLAADNSRLPRMTIKENLLLLTICAFNFVIMQIIYFILYFTDHQMGRIYVGQGNWVFIMFYSIILLYLGWPRLIETIQNLYNHYININKQ